MLGGAFEEERTYRGYLKLAEPCHSPLDVQTSEGPFHSGLLAISPGIVRTFICQSDPVRPSYQEILRQHRLGLENAGRACLEGVFVPYRGPLVQGSRGVDADDASYCPALRSRRHARSGDKPGCSDCVSRQAGEDVHVQGGQPDGAHEIQPCGLQRRGGKGARPHFPCGIQRKAKLNMGRPRGHAAIYEGFPYRP